MGINLFLKVILSAIALLAVREAFAHEINIKPGKSGTYAYRVDEVRFATRSSFERGTFEQYLLLRDGNALARIECSKKKKTGTIIFLSRPITENEITHGLENSIWKSVSIWAELGFDCYKIAEALVENTAFSKPVILRLDENKNVTLENL